ncbi:MAG: CDP-glucose 4,6-dehydratase [Thermoleophilaceae bacterium]|nr:CDP-glucose 4,6-dehydratase [Thermoleophilaceae bacterium]
MLPFERVFVGKKILVTGHSGFTGSWACSWLNTIGAEVAGFSLPPETTPSLFVELELADRVKSTFGDIRDLPTLTAAVAEFEPEFILHLAAQPLVMRSHREPALTFEVNAQGTANVLEAARATASVKAVLCVTTDKVYKNRGTGASFVEGDELGGDDPYSASKAAAELVINSYVQSSRATGSHMPVVAVARGGNIIGGGDWSEDRLVADFVRAVESHGKLSVRFPQATRPWQHVLALVHGYLLLLAGLSAEDHQRFAKPWNLGPRDDEQFSVRDVVDLMCASWRSPELEYGSGTLAESKFLAIDSSMAREELRWNPVWDTRRAITETTRWYEAFYGGASTARDITDLQIEAWRSALVNANE